MARIQNIRKESGFDVTDKILVQIQKHELINDAVANHATYIGSQTLAQEVSLIETLENNGSKRIDIEDDVFINILVTRI